MMMNNDVKKGLYRKALFLSIFTIVYNILEGLISVYFGIKDNPLTLFGFGIDSFIEAISGLGIVHMVLRIENHEHHRIGGFEKKALQITGISFTVYPLEFYFD